MANRLENLVEMLEKCTVCHDMCLAYTPELKFLSNQSYVTSRKALAIYMAVRGQLEWSMELAEVVYTGLNSGLQKYNCMFPDGQDETIYLRAARAELVRIGVLPPYIAKLKETLESSGNLFGEEFQTPTVEGKGSLALVFDAATRQLAPKVRNSAIAVFNRMGIDFAVVDIASSGFLEHDLGFHEQAKICAKSTVALLKKHGINRVISTDPALVYSIKALYQEELDQPTDIEVLHFSEWLSKQIAADKGKWNVGLNHTVTFHDPSELSRYLQITEEPREAIKNMLPGNNYVDMIFNRKQARPSGPKLGYPYPKEAEQLSAALISDARLIGAEMIVTASPFSKFNLNKISSDIRILDIAELAELAIEVEPAIHKER